MESRRFDQRMGLERIDIGTRSWMSNWRMKSKKIDRRKELERVD